jgi:hypothetical protein
MTRLVVGRHPQSALNTPFVHMICGQYLAGVQPVHTTGRHTVTYLEELEERFHKDPSSVDRSWASFFTNLGAFLLLTRVDTALY